MGFSEDQENHLGKGHLSADRYSFGQQQSLQDMPCPTPKPTERCEFSFGKVVYGCNQTSWFPIIWAQSQDIQSEPKNWELNLPNQHCERRDVPVLFDIPSLNVFLCPSVLLPASFRNALPPPGFGWNVSCRRLGCCGDEGQKCWILPFLGFSFCHIFTCIMLLIYAALCVWMCFWGTTLLARRSFDKRRCSTCLGTNYRGIGTAFRGIPWRDLMFLTTTPSLFGKFAQCCSAPNDPTLVSGSAALLPHPHPKNSAPMQTVNFMFCLHSSPPVSGVSSAFSHFLKGEHMFSVYASESLRKKQYRIEELFAWASIPASEGPVGICHATWIIHMMLSDTLRREFCWA